jgi:ATP-dependent Zn protease
VHKVSIIPRGVGALGYTIQRPTEDRFLMTREELENKMAVLLGGRAAEFIVFGHLSTGAADDLARVTDIARSMITRYGMSERLGHVALEKDGRSFLSPNPLADGARERTYSDETATAIDDEVRASVDSVFDRTVAILSERRNVLERTARRLLGKETLDEASSGSSFTINRNRCPSARSWKSSTTSAVAVAVHPLERVPRPGRISAMLGAPFASEARVRSSGEGPSGAEVADHAVRE